MIYILRAAIIGASLVLPVAAFADEFYVGDPVVKEGIEFVPNYLTGIEMDRHAPGMSMDANAVHFEIDIHASKGERHGFAEGAWIPYLTVDLTLEKLGGGLKESKRLVPMTAADGPHYANNFAVAGTGRYRATYRIAPPDRAGFYRHIDKKTGVPEWWQPLTLAWDFDYPSKPKKD